jgi:hypothetical protein
MVVNGYVIEPKADLRWANLRGANLKEANLRWANLRGANLEGANLDFACWPLWCGSLSVRVDRRIAVQLAYHFCALNCDDVEFLRVRQGLLAFANGMHLQDAPRLA